MQELDDDFVFYGESKRRPHERKPRQGKKVTPTADEIRTLQEAQINEIKEQLAHDLTNAPFIESPSPSNDDPKHPFTQYFTWIKSSLSQHFPQVNPNQDLRLTTDSRNQPTKLTHTITGLFALTNETIDTNERLVQDLYLRLTNHVTMWRQLRKLIPTTIALPQIVNDVIQRIPEVRTK